MKNGLTRILAFGFGAALLQFSVVAQDFKDQKEKVSYAIGQSYGTSLKRNGCEVDVDVLAAALRDALAGKEMKLTDQQLREVLTTYQKELRAKQDEERKKTAEKNKKEGDAFLAENKKKAGIAVQEVKLPDGSTAEMQYKVVTEGTGAIPKSNDLVVVKYRGTLPNGKEFDNSTKRPEPMKFMVNRVPMKGWSEAVQKMKVGSKWELYLPSSLAFGDFGRGTDVEPGSAVIFEMELVGIEAPPAPAAPQAQPLTSDIIRVPSEAEMKKGAKPEVIKPEDVERIAREEKAKSEKK